MSDRNGYGFPAEPDDRPDRQAAGDRPDVLPMLRYPEGCGPSPLRPYIHAWESGGPSPVKRPPFLRPAVDALRLQFKAAPDGPPPPEPA